MAEPYDARMFSGAGRARAPARDAAPSPYRQPREAAAVKLGFNFWIDCEASQARRAQLPQLPLSSVRQLLLHILGADSDAGAQAPPPWLAPESTRGVSSAVVVSVRNAPQEAVQEALPRCEHLRACSSVPVRHYNAASEGRHSVSGPVVITLAAGVLWTEDFVSFADLQRAAILAKERSPAQGDHTAASLEAIFRSHTLVFEAAHLFREPRLLVLSPSGITAPEEDDGAGARALTLSEGAVLREGGAVEGGYRLVLAPAREHLAKRLRADEGAGCSGRRVYLDLSLSNGDIAFEPSGLPVLESASESVLFTQWNYHDRCGYCPTLRLRRAFVPTERPEHLRGSAGAAPAPALSSAACAESRMAGLLLGEAAKALLRIPFDAALEDDDFVRVQTAAEGAGGVWSGPIGIDCEMCYTAEGLELCRCVCVDADGATLYDERVKPAAAVVDANTGYSGLRAGDLEAVRTTLQDVQRHLQERLGERSILVGHSLECDLRCLKLIAPRVIDTAALFPHPRGGAFHRKLRDLAREHLGERIQEGHGIDGHDPRQDALVALRLALAAAAERRRGNARYGVPGPWAADFALPRDSFASTVRRATTLPAVRLSAHLVRDAALGTTRGEWSGLSAAEAFALGARSEDDAAAAFEDGGDAGEDGHCSACVWHGSAEEAIEGAIEERGGAGAGTAGLLWVDAPLGRGAEADGGLRSVAELDALLGRLMEALDEEALLIVAFQGSVKDLRRREAAEAKARWRRRDARAGKAIVEGPRSLSTSSRRDQQSLRELRQAARQARDGALFLWRAAPAAGAAWERDAWEGAGPSPGL